MRGPSDLSYERRSMADQRHQDLPKHEWSDLQDAPFGRLYAQT